jgi:hypothetical protein
VYFPTVSHSIPRQTIEVLTEAEGTRVQIRDPSEYQVYFYGFILCSQDSNNTSVMSSAILRRPDFSAHFFHTSVLIFWQFFSNAGCRLWRLGSEF